MKNSKKLLNILSHQKVLINVIQKHKNTDKNQHLMQNINDAEYLCEMIQSKGKLKAVENHLKNFQI